MFRLLFLCAFAIVFSCCNKENTNSNNATGEAAQANTAAASPAAAPAVKKNYEASHEAPFCKLWVVQVSTDPENQEAYKGLWFDLKKNGTFLSGNYQEENNSGTWSIDKDTNIISLFFQKSSIIAPNWQIQGSGGGGRILWKGNVSGNPRGIQVILNEDNVRPSKG